MLRSEAPFSAAPSSAISQNLNDSTDPVPELTEPLRSAKPSYTVEILQTLLAGGVAGSLSAILTYP